MAIPENVTVEYTEKPGRRFEVKYHEKLSGDRILKDIWLLVVVPEDVVNVYYTEVTDKPEYWHFDVDRYNNVNGFDKWKHFPMLYSSIPQFLTTINRVFFAHPQSGLENSSVEFYNETDHIRISVPWYYDRDTFDYTLMSFHNNIYDSKYNNRIPNENSGVEKKMFWFDMPFDDTVIDNHHSETRTLTPMLAWFMTNLKEVYNIWQKEHPESPSLE